MNERAPEAAVGTTGGTAAPPSGAAGKRTLTAGMSRRIRYLRELAVDPLVPLEVWIPTTVEYQHYRKADLVWQWGAKVSGDEAILACKLIVLAMRGGQRVDWQMEARSYLNQARDQLGIKVGAEPIDRQPAARGDGAIAPVEAEPEIPQGQVEDQGPEGGEAGQVDNDETHDPGIPGNLGELVETAKRLAEFLDKHGNPEKASRARFLAAGIASGLVSLGVVAGVYLVAVEFTAGKVIVVWTPVALESPDFIRRVARVDRIVAQLNANLSEVDKIKAEAGPEWVGEADDGISEVARDYQDDAEGARSNIRTGQREVPIVEGVRFDGWDGDVLIDRKRSIRFTDKMKTQAMRQSHALAKSGRRAFWEVPNAAEARRVARFFDELGITNITARVAP